MNTRRFGILASLAVALCGLGRPTGVHANPVVTGEEHCVVNVRSDDRLNLRVRPNASSPILARWRYGQCGIMITGTCQGDWCPVEDGHYAGWAHRRYLSMVSPAMYCVTEVAEWDGLNIRVYPSATSRVLTRLGPHQCDIAFLPFATGTWQKVRVGGWEGWVSHQYLSAQ